MIKFDKTAQIGIFVIVATILVIGGIFLFTYNSDNIALFNDEKSSYKVKGFVESCLDTQAKIAVNEIGIHGGWLYHPPMKFAERDTNKYMIQHMKGMDYFGLEIPYWYYYDDSAEKFMVNIPSYTNKRDQYSLLNQVERYLDENLEKNCIQSFKNFENVYDIEYEPKEINVNVEFDDNDMILSLDLPLIINEKNTNNSEFIEHFEVKKENKLYVPYHLAKDIVLAEANSSFVEKSFIEFIYPYQDTEGRDLLPPFYDFEFGKFDMDFWDVGEVENLFKEIISSNINNIKFLGTNYEPTPIPEGLEDSQFVQSIYKMYTKDYLSDTSETFKNNSRLFKSYKNFEVNMNYEVFYPTFFSLAPSLGDILLMPRPEMLLNLFPIFFTEYTAVYEATMPILFELKRHDSPNDKFVFNLLIESNIDYNGALADKQDFGFDYEKLNMENDKTLICDPNQFNSGFIILNISDPILHGERKYDVQSRRYTTNPRGIDDAMVSFNCKGITTCFIGKTEINGIYTGKNITRLKFKVPTNCDPGTLEIYKFGYKKLKFENLNPVAGENIVLTPENGEDSFNMDSPKTLELRVKLSETLYGDKKSLNNEDNLSGFIIFENKENEELIQVVDFNYSNQYNLSVDLVSGNYKVSGFVITEKPFDIPEEEMCYSTGLFSGNKCQTIPEVHMDSWIYGGIELENFEVTLRDLLNNDRINVQMVDFGIPTSYADLKEKANLMNYLKARSISMKPDFE